MIVGHEGGVRSAPASRRGVLIAIRINSEYPLAEGRRGAGVAGWRTSRLAGASGAGHRAVCCAVAGGKRVETRAKSVPSCVKGAAHRRVSRRMTAFF